MPIYRIAISLPSSHHRDYLATKALHVFADDVVAAVLLADSKMAESGLTRCKIAAKKAVSQSLSVYANPEQIINLPASVLDTEQQRRRQT